MTVNYRSKGEGTLDVHFPLCALNAPAARGDEDYVARVKDLSLTGDQYALLNGAVKYVGVTPRFREPLRGGSHRSPAGQPDLQPRHRVRSVHQQPQGQRGRPVQDP